MDLPAELRVLTVRQPWAWALIEGLKDIENRSWQTSRRGSILLHAGAAKPSAVDMAKASARAGRVMPVDEPRGAIIGAIKIAGIHSYDQCQGQCSPWAEREDWHWEITEPMRLPTPVPATGALNLWRLHGDALVAVLDQLPDEQLLCGPPVHATGATADSRNRSSAARARSAIKPSTKGASWCKLQPPRQRDH